MIHFIYLILFALFASVAFAVFATGTTKQKVIRGVKDFLQFVIISLVLAWILYFVPW